MITYEAPLWMGILIGFIIGAAAEPWGIGNPETMIRLAKWEDRLFINCIFMSVAVAAPVIFGLYAAGVGFHWSPRPVPLIGVALGGFIFGIGMAIAGYSPGSVWMALGEGRRDAIYAILGGLVGAAAWIALYQTPAGPWLLNTLNLGQLMIGATHPAGEEYLVPWDGLTPFDLFLISLGYSAVMFAISYYLPRYRGGHTSCLRRTLREHELSAIERAHRLETAKFQTYGGLPYDDKSIAKKLNEYWAVESNIVRWFMAILGAIIGLSVVAETFLHQVFGESTGYAWMAGWLFMPDFKYSQIVFNDVGWEPYVDIGLVMGALFSSVFLTRKFTAFRRIIPPSYKKRFGDDEAIRALGAFVGTALMTFSSRMAVGCASSHLVSGLIQMSISAFVFGATLLPAMMITARLVYGGE